MRLLPLLLLMLATAPPLEAQVGVDSLNMTLFDHLNPVDSVGLHASIWGYVAPDNREYALVGSQIGTYIIDVTERPIRVVSYIWGPRNAWRELKTYGTYAYVVTESPDSGNGLQIIDLSQLPDTATLVRTDTSFFRRSHTITINDHFLLANGTPAEAGANGGTILLDLEPDPLHPRRVGAVTPYYFHDAWMRNDTLLGAAIHGEGCDIWDVGDPANPVRLATITYPYSGTHNCEMTSDGRYVLTTDEVGFTPKTLKVWDITDLENIRKVAEFSPNRRETVHNVHVRGDYAIVAWYTAGVRIVDVSDPVHPREVAFYDTYGGADGGFNGVWEAFGPLPSGRILVGDRNTGLYVLNWEMKKGGSISGRVLDSLTGEPLPGVTIRGEDGAPVAITGADGRYYIGGVEGESIAITAVKFAYDTLAYATILDGDAEHDLRLTPRPLVTARLRAIDAETGEPLPEFRYAVAPILPSTGSSNGAGVLLLPRGDPYRVTVGVWGYRVHDEIVRLDSAGGTVDIALERGYYDNATLDLGWSYSEPGDAATSGRWLRAIPYLGYVGSEWIHPPSEPAAEPGGYVFMTGLPASDAPPQLTDVNGGSTTLTTPMMDLSSYVRPYVSIDLWLVQYYRDSIVDTFRIEISNDDGATWRTAWTGMNQRAGWHQVVFPLDTALPPTSSVRVRFVASDPRSTTLFNVAIDDFLITEGVPPSGVDIEERAGPLPLWIVPNPASSSGRLELTLDRPAGELTIRIVDILGRTVGTSRLPPTATAGSHLSVPLDLPSAPGRYIVQVLAGDRPIGSAPLLVTGN